MADKDREQHLKVSQVSLLPIMVLIWRNGYRSKCNWRRSKTWHLQIRSLFPLSGSWWRTLPSISKRRRVTICLDWSKPYLKRIVRAALRALAELRCSSPRVLTLVHQTSLLTRQSWGFSRLRSIISPISSVSGLIHQGCLIPLRNKSAGISLAGCIHIVEILSRTLCT